MRDDQNFKVLQRSFAFLPRAADAINKFTHLAAHKNPRFVINELNVFDPTIRKRIFVLIDKFRIVCTLICYLLLGILEEFVAELLDLLFVLLLVLENQLIKLSLYLRLLIILLYHLLQEVPFYVSLNHELQVVGCNRIAEDVAQTLLIPLTDEVVGILGYFLIVASHQLGNQ